MILDPRDELPKDPHDVLTEDSDDELADLEKEFEARKARLLEKREKKKQLASQSVQIERSPSPETEPRKKEQAEGGQSHARFGNKQSHESLSNQSHERTESGQSQRQSIGNEYSQEEESINGPSQKRGVVIGFSQSNRTIDDSKNQTPKLLKIPLLSQGMQVFQRVPTSNFAKKLHEIEKAAKPEIQNYNERIFEFEKIPAKKIIKCSEEKQIDPVSGEVLRRRYLEESVVTRFLSNFKILRATKLLAKVFPPKFEEPRYINWCLAGILMHKSEPKITSNNSKYMALRVGLFAHTVDVMLFGDAFKKYWKLQCGDVLIFLNPSVKAQGNRFSLSLRDDLDSIIEIGTLKNYGKCSAMTTQGERCKFIVDVLKNELCSYHEESKFKQRSRMELQGSVKPKAPRDSNGNVKQMYFNQTSQKPLFITVESAGIHEKDMIYAGGEQFDELKYDRPIVESSAAKALKQKANQKLRLQLLMNAAPARLGELQKLGLVSNQPSESGSGCKLALEQLRLQAYNRGFVKGIGYDPVANMMSPSSENQKTTSVNKALDELRSLSCGKTVSLKPSRQDKSAKLLKRKRALNIIRTPEASADKIDELSFATVKRKKPLISVLDGEISTDGSDLEISFASEADKSKYNSVCLQGRTGVKSVEPS